MITSLKYVSKLREASQSNTDFDLNGYQCINNEDSNFWGKYSSVEYQLNELQQEISQNKAEKNFLKLKR